MFELDGVNVAVAPREYFVLRKLEYFREGGSQKHLRDIQSILEMAGADVDLAFVGAQVEKRGLADVWAQI